MIIIRLLKWIWPVLSLPFLLAADGAGEAFVSIATSPLIVTLLLIVILTGFTLELFTPGFGIPGAAGALALLVFTAAHVMSGEAEVWTVLLIAAGVLFVLVEIFLPGGIVGLIGLILFAAGVLFAGASLVWMAFSLLLALLIASAVLILMIKVLGKDMKFFKKFILSDSTDTDQGYVSNVNRTELIGKIGKTKTALRPSGTVVVDGERIDAVAEGVFIAAGKEVAVVKVEGVRIVVREID